MQSSFENTGLDERLVQYVLLFNERYFYDAHEVLEDLWHDTPGEERQFYQALIHLAAAFHHLVRGNHAGFEARLKTAAEYFATYPKVYCQFDVGELTNAIRYWREMLDNAQGKTIVYDDGAI